MSSPLQLTSKTAERTGTPSDIRTGTVAAVTSRGIDVTVGSGRVEGAAHLTSYNPAVGDTVTMIYYANSWVVLGRAVGPGTGTDNVTPGTGIGMTLLDGCVLSLTNTDMATSTGAEVTVPRYGVTFYHPTGHWVMIMMTYSWYSSVASDVLTVRLKESISGNTVASIDHIQAGVGNIGQFSTFALMMPPTLGGAKRSYFLTVQRFSGTGTVRIFDPNTRRGSMLAYDAGDQAIIRTV